jgi:RNA polymerase sigma-70 factor, ECF subfamily
MLLNTMPLRNSMKSAPVMSCRDMAAHLLQPAEPKKMTPAQSDEDVICRIRAGDRESYGLLAVRHAQRLNRLAKKLVRDPADAEDAVQNAHLLALAHFDQYQGRSPYVRWMVSITVNAVRTGFRRNKAWAGCEELQDCYAAATPSPEQAAIDHETRRLVDLALDRIPPAYSTVFRMRELADLSVAETGRRLGLSNACVKSRLLRARSMLRDAIETQLGCRRLRQSLPGPERLRILGSPKYG